MSSGFFSAGGEEVKPRDGLSEYDNDAWMKARQKIEEIKKPKPMAPGTQEGGNSLYDHLQAQKAAKQEAFEEATKLRNQFRPLDDSEAAFLESIKQKEMAKVLTVRKETAEQLAAFRRDQEAAEEAARDLEASQDTRQDGEETTGEIWTASKKRRRAKDDDKLGASKSAKTAIKPEGLSTSQLTNPERSPEKVITIKHVPPTGSPDESSNVMPVQAIPKPAGVLVSYDSDSDD